MCGIQRCTIPIQLYREAQLSLTNRDAHKAAMKLYPASHASFNISNYYHCQISRHHLHSCLFLLVEHRALATLAYNGVHQADKWVPNAFVLSWHEQRTWPRICTQPFMFWGKSHLNFLFFCSQQLYLSQKYILHILHAFQLIQLVKHF